MAQVNFALTGTLDDVPHPCVSEVVRRWVIRIQDALPDDVRNSEGWRHAAVGIAGSAGSEADEAARVALLLAWMWERLGDEAVVVPVSAQKAWRRMLVEKTSSAARDAYNAYAAATYAAATYAAAYAAAAAAAAYAASDAAYWQRADAPGMLTRLIACRAVST